MKFNILKRLINITIFLAIYNINAALQIHNLSWFPIYAEYDIESAVYPKWTKGTNLKAGEVFKGGDDKWGGWTTDSLKGFRFDGFSDIPGAKFSYSKDLNSDIGDKLILITNTLDDNYNLGWAYDVVDTLSDRHFYWAN